MLRKLLDWLFKKSDKGTGTVRWYVLGSERWGFGVKIHLNDCPEGQEWHTHPWNGLAIIFGTYAEQRWDQDWQTRWFINRVLARTPHRIRTYRPTYTLFVHGPRSNEQWWWGQRQAPWRGPDDEPKKSE